MHITLLLPSELNGYNAYAKVKIRCTVFNLYLAGKCMYIHKVYIGIKMENFAIMIQSTTICCAFYSAYYMIIMQENTNGITQNYGLHCTQLHQIILHYIKSYYTTSDHTTQNYRSCYAKLRTKLCTTLKYYTQSYIPKLCNVP